MKDSTKKAPSEQVDRLPYESPAIIYEGTLTTRAGTGVPGSSGNEGVDPADLFGEGG